MVEERYYETLKDIHTIMRPANYLEVGVRRGDSWQLLQAMTRSVGIDPAPQLTMTPPGDAKLFVGTSDDFFAMHDPKSILGGGIELSFIDGMHLFEFALRDFANIERHSSKNGIILVHDCFPISEETAGRVQSPNLWTGDIWKLVVCLKETRPDLKIDVLDVSPSGLAIIQNLNPGAEGFRATLTNTIKRYVDLPYSYLGDRQTMRQVLNVCTADGALLAKLCGRRGLDRLQRAD